MILITGASGKTGRAVLQALRGSAVEVRALIHRPGQEQEMAVLGANDVMVGDMGDAVVMQRALQGVASIYHICPNMSPDETAIGEIVIGAAVRAEVQHFVYHSVLHPQIESMPHHWQKMRVEALLFESGMPFTILQPTAYMQNILAHRDAVLRDGVYPVPYAASARISMVDLDDVGEAAGRVLLTPGHEGAIYELAGTTPLSQTDVATTIAKVLGSNVDVSEIELDTWKRQAADAGLGAYQIQSLVSMFRYYDRHGLAGNTNVLEMLLGRTPTSFHSFATTHFPSSARAH